MQKLTKNDFRGGLNTDVSPNLIQPTYYVDAHNLELVGDGKFFDLKNIKGTTLVQNIINVPNTRVLKVFENFYKIDTTERVKCLTIITANSSTINYFCFDTENVVLYELYEEVTPGDYLTDDRLIDGRSYAENGIDILYFTDNYNELRKLRCEIPFPYVANFLTEFDLSLQRWGANGVISLESDVVDTGGSLLSGTYQFAYRMCTPDTKKFTKWSSLTNPIHIYSTISSSPDRYSSGIGLYTDRKITLHINPTALELDNFEHFQLAVIENIYPTGALSIESEGVSTSYASLLEIKEVADFITGSTINVEYVSNNKIGTISIDELTIDNSAIESAKTLVIKNNRLFAGNIHYKNLTVDTPPSITGTIITNNGRATELNATLNKGYFRGEVYRFGIVYFDKYGNKSSPYVLDMSSVTGNQINTLLSTDYKFPERNLNNSYSLLTSLNIPRNLGLDLTVDNHPTWATGFEIVRLDRKKRILFQTPVIPYTTIKGIGAFYNYPTTYNTDAGTTEVANAQPMTSDVVYAPKNLLWPEMRKITNVTATSPAGSGINTRIKGEAKLEISTSYNFAGIFPPESQYNNKEFTFSGSEQLEQVDYVHLKVDYTAFSTSTYNDGDYIETDVAATFYALNDEQYYYDAAWVAKASILNTNSINDSIYLDNYSEGGTLSGGSITEFSQLDTDGIEYLGNPNNQRITVVSLKEAYDSETNSTIPFSVGNKLLYSAGSAISSATATPVYESGTNYTNKFINEYSGFVNNSTLVQVLRIVNCINPNIGDNRYGDNTEGFISTGSKYFFSSSELVDVEASNSVPISIEVWGGDCFVSAHTFKICDSTYSVLNQQKQALGGGLSTASAADKWDKVFFAGATVISMPISVKGCSQFVEVFLESEYNGEVTDSDILTEESVGVLSPPKLVNAVQNLNKTSLNYVYNINLNKSNSQKVYFEKPEFSFEQYNFGSRIQYSDIKIYNTSEQGFDTFRVGNTADLEESGGDITKLSLSGDDVYAIQQKRIVYVPIGEKLLETSDAGIIQVGSGEVINQAKVIESKRGGQHLGAIIETGSAIIIPDNINKAVYSLENQDFKIISDEFVASTFRDYFSSVIPEKDLNGLLDPIKKEYWVFSDDFCLKFNFMLNKWIGNIEWPSLLQGQYTNQSLYTLSTEADQISVYSMYTGSDSPTTLAGEVVIPRVSFYVNPDADFSKTFDNMMFNCNERLDKVDLLVTREGALGNQEVLNTSIDINPVEGNYRIKTLRDGDGTRLRGLRMKATVYWNEASALSSVFTKYRTSSRNPF